MSKVIRVDEDVLRKLQEKARELNIPFSNSNNLLRVILGLCPLPGQRHQPTVGKD